MKSASSLTNIFSYFNRIFIGCCVIIVTIFIVVPVIFAQTLRFTPPVISQESLPNQQLSNQISAPQNFNFNKFPQSNQSPYANSSSSSSSSNLSDKVVPLPQITEDKIYVPLQKSQPLQNLSLPSESGASSSSQHLTPLPLYAPVPVLHPELRPKFRNPLPLPVPANAEKLETILRNGEVLERESRWADALTHYEGGLQIYRNNNQLLERFLIARFHYDIRRRCEDVSYINCIKAASFVDSLSLYEEIISRIHSNYAEAPNWDKLFRNGLCDVLIALDDVKFRSKSNLSISPDKIDVCVALLRKTADGWEISNRDDLKNGVLRLAEISLQQINLNPVIFLMEFTCGIANSLDPYTTYLTPNQHQDTHSMILGNFVGLGVELKSDRESLMIVRVIHGSPAKEAGLLNGDRIISVDGISTRGKDTDVAANLLQGLEDTFTELTVQTPGMPVRNVKVLRRRIEVPSVEELRMLNSEVGYIKLTGFQTRTIDEMRRAVVELESRGMRCLVLDLRHNPGGLFQVGVDVANLFINNGVIVRTRGRQGTVETPYHATNVNTFATPLILLIDEASASASEIVAGAIKDHKRGLLVGRRTYGKGTIQAILPINGNNPNARAGLRITVEKFFSPQGVAYSGVGVMPDIVVESEQRISVAKLIDGKLQIPVNVSAISTSQDDLFIKEAIKASQKILGK
ncbi:MAG: S41 family peptidase [Planctomycetaceae bacterium]|jgi:carboxyl-terminal processing protease|nr:S41 family peptidase [Planctomycetaceae bacterium]